MIVAIDGPAGAGKSTVARSVARELGLIYIDSGAMYRAVALIVSEHQIKREDEHAIMSLAQSLSIIFSPLDADNRQRVSVDGRDVTDAIRKPDISSLTSSISAIPDVRRVMVALQRKLAEQDRSGAVMEGRDIGTVVFPNANVKVFLTASPEERARRRVAELNVQGLNVDYAQILSEQNERDNRDSCRDHSPLTVATDAVVLNTDHLTVTDVAAKIVDLCRSRMGSAASELSAHA